jgi:type I restriction enzyme, S subunit
MANTILHTLPIWTTAQTIKSNGRSISVDNQKQHGIDKLRELILELAVRGKLVQQDPNDEPASELLKKIEKERNLLIKKGKIKKPKFLPAIEDVDCPFELPTGWEYVRLNDIGEWGSGSTPNRSRTEYYGGNIPWFKSGELVGDYISNAEEFITELALKETSLRYNNIGDVLIAMYGATIGKTSILSVSATTNQAVCACTPFQGILNIFLLTLLKAYKTRFIEMGAGGAQPNISKEKIIVTVIALPPLSEQHRIVAKVDELMALCDQMEQLQTNNNKAHQAMVEVLLDTLTQTTSPVEFEAAWQRIAQHFDTLFTTEYSIDHLKQAILQLAVMGKLVPQNPTDEPASELLKKIVKEKECLVKEGKIKSENSLPSITNEEIHYKLPMNWIWCRMQDLCPNISSGSTPENRFFIQSGVPFLKVYNIRNQKIDFSYKEQFIGQDINSSKLKRSILKPGDVIMNIVGPPLGKIAIIPNDYDEWNCNQAIVFFKPVIRKINQWLYTFLCAETFLKDIELIGTAGQDNISVTKSKNIVIPLPPFTEQHRIVSKVDELFALCDALKERIKEAQVTQVQLAEAMVVGALT